MDEERKGIEKAEETGIEEEEEEGIEEDETTKLDTRLLGASLRIGNKISSGEQDDKVARVLAREGKKACCLEIS